MHKQDEYSVIFMVPIGPSLRAVLKNSQAVHQRMNYRRGVVVAVIVW
jgi:hypothetical protein